MKRESDINLSKIKEKKLNSIKSEIEDIKKYVKSSDLLDIYPNNDTNSSNNIINDTLTLTNVVNDLYGSDMTSAEYANHWKTAQYLDSTSNWGDVTMGVDLINELGSFDAASVAKDLGTDLQTVADSIYAAANVGVSTDLEAAAQGLGYSSFAAAVDAYNKQYGTNYTTETAKEALGQ